MPMTDVNKKDAMFLIAGVQPKTRRVDDQPRRCPACGRMQAYTTRVDHYLSLFFIPLVRVKQGERFLLCEYCGRPMDTGPSPEPAAPLSGTDITCVACGKSFDRSFNYCPHCGQRA
ncbi:zinc ribbon domain-containing protein [Desulfosarcina ovata]|nr:zinc ribbon domain-containing protein [Desulfosarcina ovata]